MLRASFHDPLVDDASFAQSLRALSNLLRSSLPALVTKWGSTELVRNALLYAVSLKVLQSSSKSDRLTIQEATALSERFSSIPGALSSGLTCPESAALFSETGDLLKDPRLSHLWLDPSAIGFTYQAFGMVFRKQVLKQIQVANKPDVLTDVISFTQQYTPRWVITFLLTKTLAPLLGLKDLPPDFARWCQNSDTKDDISTSTDTIRILDPACGAGHFLLCAYELMREAFAAAGASGFEAVRLAVNSLGGADIDQSAVALAQLSLLVRALLDEPRHSIDLSKLIVSNSLPRENEREVLGSISTRWKTVAASPLSEAYDVVVTNPPYIGRRLLSRSMKESLTTEYPASRSDLCAAFLDRSVDWLKPGGRLGVITQGSLLSLPSYAELRKRITSTCEIEQTAALGGGVFPLLSGEKADSLLLVARKSVEPGEGTTSPIHPDIRLNSADQKASKLAQTFSRNRQPTVLDFAAEIESLSSRLGDIADVRQGLATTDNARFVRLETDVLPETLGVRWFPYAKGAGSERWSATNKYVVNWENDGEQIKEAVLSAYPYLKGKYAWVVKNEQHYFKPGLCFSFVNKNNLAVRKLPSQAIFDVACSAIFAQKEDESFLLGYLNSSFATQLARSINPTINFQVGDIKKIPIMKFEARIKNEIGVLAAKNLELKLKLTGQLLPLTAPEDFDSMLAAQASNVRALVCTEHELDELVLTTLVKSCPRLAPLLAECPLASRDADLEFYEDLVKTRLLNRICHNLLDCDGREFPFASSVSGLEELQKLLPSQVIDRLESRTHSWRKLSQQKVIDFGKIYGQVPRYFAINLSSRGSTLWLSSRAFQNWRTTSRLRSDPAASEAEALIFLKRLTDNLKDQNDWEPSTRQLIKASLACF